MLENKWDVGQNVFEMLVANGGPGFWIRRTTWGGIGARVLRAGTFTRPPPYFGNPSVLMDVYGHEGGLKEGLATVPVPGTYKTWRRIAQPNWATQKLLRPLGDPAIDAALVKLDGKRGKKSLNATTVGPVPDATRIDLAVPYVRKDEAKAIGARCVPSFF